MQNETLGQFGYQFQVKVLTNYLTDRNFLLRGIDLIKPSYFDSDALKWICENIYSYFREYKVVPTPEVFKVQISNISEERSLRQEVITTIKEVLRRGEGTDNEFIKTELIKFGKRQAVKYAYENSILDFERGDYDAIVKKISDASKLGEHENNLGHNLIDDFEYRYTDQAEPERIKTGFEPLDEVSNGGLPKGCVGVLIAPSGQGKSWWLTQFGANAIKAGKTVLHYTLELADIYTAKRYDSLLAKIPFDDLKYHQDQVKKALSKISGKIFIKEYPPAYLSFLKLESEIEQYILLGFKPDLVILDYPELMKINFTGDRDDKVLGDLYTELRGLAKRLNFAMWIVDQTNRGGTTKDVIENDSISNSFAKIFVLDWVLTWSRKIKDKVNNTGRLHNSKSRLGPDGMTFPVKFDTHSPIIEVYSPQSESGKKIDSEMVSDQEYERAIAAREYKRQQERKGLF